MKAKVHTTRNKQMVLAFFDFLTSLTCSTNYVPRETTVNARYICGCSGLVHEDPEEEAGDGEWRLVASLG